MEMNVMVNSDAFMPERAHATDAGLDIRTPISFNVQAHGSAVVDTGVYVELPAGTCGLLVSKSGLNVNRGIVTTGLIDEGFQGQIRVKVYNLSDEDYHFVRGHKVTQLVVLPCLYVEPVEVDCFYEVTDRGDGGYGSTGL